MLSAILGAVASVVPTLAGSFNAYQARKSQVTQAKHEAKLERIRSQQGDWKDEFLIVIWSAPILMSFIPVLQPYAFKAFDYMEKLPAWYMGGWVSISLAIFGVDKLMKGLGK